jgi:hypothetical protein
VTFGKRRLRLLTVHWKVPLLVSEAENEAENEAESEAESEALNQNALANTELLEHRPIGFRILDARSHYDRFCQFVRVDSDDRPVAALRWHGERVEAVLRWRLVHEDLWHPQEMRRPLTTQRWLSTAHLWWSWNTSQL